MKGNLEWNHKAGYINIPINFNKSTDERKKSDIHIVCNECNGKVKQQYHCEQCETTTTIGQLKYKKDELNDVVFLAEAEKQYCTTKVKPILKVQKEFPLDSLMRNIEFIEKHQEIYNNEDEYAPVIKKIHQYLMRNNTALLVTYGANGRERAAIIFPQSKKLTMTDLRDFSLIREPVQLNLDEMNNEIYEILTQFTEDFTTKLYDEFIDKVKKNEKIIVENEEIEIKPIIECTFLDA